jgi:hypothetical protein
MIGRSTFTATPNAPLTLWPSARAGATESVVRIIASDGRTAVAERVRVFHPEESATQLLLEPSLRAGTSS